MPNFDPNDELRDIEEAEAWELYLTNTRNLIGWKYEDREPWEWARLTERLKEIIESHKHYAEV